MADLIDRQELLKHKRICYDEEGNLLYAVWTGRILLMPTVDAEPTKEQVREYCQRRCLTVVTTKLFNEMKARWSNEPVMRCKDCRFHNTHRCYMAFDLVATDNTDYCSRGERREDE